MRVGIVGNRVGWTYKEVRDTLKKHGVYKTDLIISGGADGVDTFAQKYAQEIGATIRIVYPDPDIASPLRYYKRNEIIVHLSNVIIAFNKEKRSGTQNTINLAKRYCKNVIVVSGSQSPHDEDIPDKEEKGENIHDRRRDLRADS